MKTGFAALKIMKMIRQAFQYTGITIKEEYWDSYDYMNQAMMEHF